MNNSAHAHTLASRVEGPDTSDMHSSGRLTGSGLQNPGGIHDRIDISKHGDPILGPLCGGDIQPYVRRAPYCAGDSDALVTLAAKASYHRRADQAGAA
jgi:hypothetical protein